MSSDEEVDEFGRTRVKNRKKSKTPSPPRHKRNRRSSPRRSRSPRKRSRSPRRSPKRDRERSPRERRSGREQREQRGSPPPAEPRAYTAYTNAREPTKRDRGRRKEEPDPTFDSAVDSYVNTLRKITKPKIIHTVDEDDDDPVLAAAMEDDTNLEEEQMAKLMGFGSFDSTKGKKTDASSNASATFKQPKRKYRQYMNRRGGFNRPLDPIL